MLLNEKLFILKENRWKIRFILITKIKRYLLRGFLQKLSLRLLINVCLSNIKLLPNNHIIIYKTHSISKILCSYLLNKFPFSKNFFPNNNQLILTTRHQIHFRFAQTYTLNSRNMLVKRCNEFDFISLVLCMPYLDTLIITTGYNFIFLMIKKQASNSILMSLILL